MFGLPQRVKRSIGFGGGGRSNFDAPDDTQHVTVTAPRIPSGMPSARLIVTTEGVSRETPFDGGAETRHAVEPP